MAHTTLSELRKRLKKAHERLESWNLVGEEFNITGGLAYRIAVDGHEPKDPAIRARLSLPVIVPTPACPDCGTVHTIEGVCIAHSRVTVTVVEMTAEELAKVDRPVSIIVRKTPGRRKEQRARATINLENPKSAARTIRRKMDAETVNILVELLGEWEDK